MHTCIYIVHFAGVTSAFDDNSVCNRYTCIIIHTCINPGIRILRCMYAVYVLYMYMYIHVQKVLGSIPSWVLIFQDSNDSVKFRVFPPLT